MYFEGLLDVTAVIPPLIAILFLVRQKGSTVGLAKNNLLRLCFYFLALVGFDSLRDLAGITWAVYGVLFCMGMIVLSFGHVVAVINYCPEVKTLKESIRQLLRKTWANAAYHVFNVIGMSWMALSFLTPIGISSLNLEGGGAIITTTFPAWYQTISTIMMAFLAAYPSLLLLLAVKRAKVPAVKHSLFMLLTGWLCLPISLFFALLQISPQNFMAQAGLLVGSIFFVLCAASIRNNYGIIRVLTSQLTPQPVLKTGHKYLVLHDGGKGLISFLSASLQSIIESGGRVIINSSKSLQSSPPSTSSTSSGGLIEGLKRGQPRFDVWLRSGKVVNSIEREIRSKESLSERFSQGPSQFAFVRELDTEDLRNNIVEDDIGEKSQASSELYLLESSKAPRPLLSEFLSRNREMEVLNVSETRDTFSSLLNLSHLRIQGSKILLEYDTAVTVDDIVSRFFNEGISNAELCALFTTKSSKLYRTLKGNRMVKMVAASSLVSVMDELPDGEVQIPDHELGLVTSIVSDLLESNNATNASIVFDSIPELIMGETWEQVYSGIKQLFELASVPAATVVFLTNKDTMDPKLLGAIRSFFTVQLRLDTTGLHIVKLRQF